MKKKVICTLLMICILFSLAPDFADAATKNKAQPGSGWYYLRMMKNYLNIDEEGNLELRNKSDTKEGNTKFRVYNIGNGDYEFELEDGRYIGIDIKKDGNIKGQRLKAVKKDEKKYMTSWNVYSENNYDLFNIRPRMNKDYAISASGEKKEDGTPLIMNLQVDRWVCAAYPTPNAPEHAEIRFIPVLPAVYKVKQNDTPYRDKPDGKLLGKLKHGDKVWVTEISGDWATVKYEGKTSYIWATKIESVDPNVDAPIVVKRYPSKTEYKVGEKYNITGLKVVDITGGKEKLINDDLTFELYENYETKNGMFTKDPVKIKVGHKFSKTMYGYVKVYYKGIFLLNYDIEVMK